MVKATFKGKREPMELEGDMILGTTIQYDAIRDSGAFIIGDVKFSILPGALARMAALLKTYFSGEELEKAYADFHTTFLATTEAAWEEDSGEEETGKEN